jgi:enoyl-[acyl-carrier protein] reductase II
LPDSILKHTRLCDLFGITYPIIQGGMLWIATAELGAAVSNAGGLGVISPLAGMTADADSEPAANFTNHIAQVRKLTSRPFGVNIPLDLEYADALIETALRQQVQMVITAAGSPARFSKSLKNCGVKVLHVVSSVKQAVKAEACGVDAVVAEGVEAAAHIGIDELPLFALIPQVVDAVSIPVIAAGGIADARGVVAALALGAEGVQLGTRFVATDENIAHRQYKQAIVDARDTDTVVTCRSFLPTRSLKTDFAETLIELEKSGAGIEAMREFIGYRSNRTAQIEGDLSGGEIYCGASAGLIKEILPVKEVIRQLVEGYAAVLKRL